MTNDAPRLPGLTTTDTRWLIAEAQRVFTDLGHRTTIVDGVALDIDDGRTMGLDNLARTISLIPRSRWSRAVHDQLTTLEGVRPDEPPAEEDLRVKLWPVQRAQDSLTYDALEPLPGLVAVIAAQGPGFSYEFGSLDVVGDRDTAYDTALGNMTRLPRPRHSRRRVASQEPSSWVEFLDSHDAYGAARVAVLPDLLRTMRIPFPPQGVLVSVPTKFELWVHVPVDETVLDTAVAMSWMALRTFAEEPYPISPDVYLVSPDMQAARLVQPDQRGFNLDERTMLGLLRSMGADLPEAS